MLEQNTLEVISPANADESAAAKPAPAAPPDVDVGVMYVDYRMLLLSVGCKKFRIPESEAENLIQEVFLSFLQAGTKIENAKAWLVAAMCNASRHYWRAQGRTEPLPEDYGERCDPSSTGVADREVQKLTVHQALEYLQPRCRQTLYLHYFEGRSAGDVAREMETTNRYAEKLIHNCLKRVREIYLTITGMKR
ncbi:MAG TPA: sigma-70 family RNA polymerase sigma factor [Thermoanaerobaculia bacterium]|nr:sigma-70 family RNA polymerase sigma factor [Thermoanaerobaculia bacterium]